MIYSKDDQVWKDEAGQTVPVSYVPALEKKKEREAAKLLKEAKRLNESLAAFKEVIRNTSKGIFDQVMKAADADPSKSKGNFTWYSFDRSIKVEVSINERIDFDDALIEAARQKLNDCLKRNLSAKEEGLLTLVNAAFETSKGKLDAKKVLGLLKFKGKIKAAGFDAAMELIEKSIRRPDSKTYHRIWEKDERGEYKVVDLNFSSI